MISENDLLRYLIYIREDFDRSAPKKWRNTLPVAFSKWILNSIYRSANYQPQEISDDMILSDGGGDKAKPHISRKQLERELAGSDHDGRIWRRYTSDLNARPMTSSQLISTVREASTRGYLAPEQTFALYLEIVQMTAVKNAALKLYRKIKRRHFSTPDRIVLWSIQSLIKEIDLNAIRLPTEDKEQFLTGLQTATTHPLLKRRIRAALAMNGARSSVAAILRRIRMER
jgi:hypothetical protein